MQLVAKGDGGPQDLPNLMHFWIENEQCIPGFLASVTLECYDKSKQEGQGGLQGSVGMWININILRCVARSENEWMNE